MSANIRLKVTRGNQAGVAPRRSTIWCDPASIVCEANLLLVKAHHGEDGERKVFIRKARCNIGSCRHRTSCLVHHPVYMRARFQYVRLRGPNGAVHSFNTARPTKKKERER